MGAINFQVLEVRTPKKFFSLASKSLENFFRWEVNQSRFSRWSSHGVLIFIRCLSTRFSLSSQGNHTQLNFEYKFSKNLRGHPGHHRPDQLTKLRTSPNGSSSIFRSSWRLREYIFNLLE
jgi:hypothetical protein